MKRSFIALALLGCLALAQGCSEDSSVDKSVGISPEVPLVLAENGGSGSFFVSIGGSTSAAVQVTITNSDPLHLTLGQSVLTFMPGSDVLTQLLPVSCIDNAVKDGDHSAILTFNFTSLDKDYNGLSLMRSVTCQDDDIAGPVVPVQTCTPGEKRCAGDGSFQICTADAGWSDILGCPDAQPVCNAGNCQAKSDDPLVPVCQAGQILCVDGLNYKSCDATTQNWAMSTQACPAERPICNMTSNQCEEGQVPVCSDVCSGDLIRRCNAGVLGESESCGEKRYCKMENGTAQCIYQGEVSFTVSTKELKVYEGGRASFMFHPDFEPTSNIVVSLSLSDSSEAKLENTSFSFSKSNYASNQTVVVTGIRDGEADGNKELELTFKVVSSDTRYQDYPIDPLKLSVIDTEADEMDYNGKNHISIRAMAANITSGNNSSYSPGHGVRIFKAVKPDIVMIQEFNWYKQGDTDTAAMKLINEAFDPGYYVFRGKGNIPNGIISRYPIIDAGYWSSNVIKDRDWNWALIDLPGKKELLVVSVHLSTDKNKQEAPSLMTAIERKVSADVNNKLDYFLMIGGDFNANYKGNGSLAKNFKVDVTLPEDQAGNSGTAANRGKTLDHLFVDKAFHKFEVPVEIGSHSYNHGHVFDSRVYKKYGELGDVSPVQGDDSGSTNMQHMAVIRDFEYSVN